MNSESVTLNKQTITIKMSRRQAAQLLRVIFNHRATSGPNAEFDLANRLQAVLGPIEDGRFGYPEDLTS